MQLYVSLYKKFTSSCVINVLPLDGISVVMVHLLTLSVVDHGFVVV